MTREPGLVTVTHVQRQAVADLLVSLAHHTPVTVEHGTGLLAGTVELSASAGARRVYARVDDDGTASSSAGWPLTPPRAEVPLPARARARTSDPDSSSAAGASIPNLNDRHRAVLHVFKAHAMHRPDHHGYLTDVELVARYGDHCRIMTMTPQQTDQSLRSRRAELVRAGHIEASDVRVPLASGRRAICWRLTTKGRTTTP